MAVEMVAESFNLAIDLSQEQGCSICASFFLQREKERERERERDEFVAHCKGSLLVMDRS